MQHFYKLFIKFFFKINKILKTFKFRPKVFCVFVLLLEITTANCYPAHINFMLYLHFILANKMMMMMTMTTIQLFTFRTYIGLDIAALHGI